MKKTNMKEEIIVLYPAPGIGHLISMVELAKHLLNTTTFPITILLTTNSPDDTLAATTYIQANTSINFHHLPPLLAPTTTAPISGAAVLIDFIRRNVPNVRHALQCISTTHVVKAFIIDLFCTSAFSVARDLRIPVYYFFTSGAAVLSYFLYFPTVDEQIDKSYNYKDLTTTFLEFPGLPLISAAHVPEPLLDRDDPAFAEFMYFFQNLSNSDGIIVNTFRDLEPISVSTLASGSCLPHSAITPPIYYIGPLISSVIKKDSTFDDKITQWLNSQPKQSVVYLCFGSRGSFSSRQLQEIATGLENSTQRFLWVIKSDDDDVLSLLPEGFLERTEERGMVVTSWVRQAEILNHESVGGFVTHCGWNSVLEAVVGGVPMVTWPLYAEQKLNKAVLVETMKIGIGLEMDKDGFVSRSELEKKVRILMNSEAEIRVRCLKMKKMAMDAWTEAGSSTAALDQLVGLWKHTTQKQS